MFWIALLFSIVLSASEIERSLINATFEGEPSAILEGCVNAISGRFFVCEPDLIVTGCEPLRLYRIFTGVKDETHRDGWEFFPHLYLTEIKRNEGTHETKRVELIAREASGASLHLEPIMEGTFLQFKLNEEKHLPGMTNTGRGEISGRTNLKNLKAMHVKDGRYTLTFGDGLKRNYKRSLQKKQIENRDRKRHYLLEEEELPNGNRILYDYDEHRRPLSIRSTNPSRDITYAWVEFSYEGEPDENPNFTFTTSDQKSFSYFYERMEYQNKRHFFLQRIKQRPHHKVEKIGYSLEKNEPIFIVRHKSAKKRQIRPYYYYDTKNEIGEAVVQIDTKQDPRYGRVRALHANTGAGGAQTEIMEIFYHLNYDVKKKKFRTQSQTHVNDSVGRSTQFFFDKHLREFRMERHFEGHSVFMQQMEWGEKLNAGNLLQKTLYDGKSPFVRKSFDYDRRGNVIKEAIEGNIRGGREVNFYKGQFDSSVTHYRYNKRNLTEHIQFPSGLQVDISYLDETNHIKSRLTSFQGKILKREFFCYNADYILIEQTLDDGTSEDSFDLSDVTTRLITRVTPSTQFHARNMPENEEQLYWDPRTGQEHLLSRQEITYNAQCRIEKIDVYDAEGEYSHSLHYFYDEVGNIIFESDALGYATRRSFDKKGNIIRLEQPNGLYCEMSYDKGNRLVSKTSHLKEKKLTSHYLYDSQSRLVQECDFQGHWTSYTYDAFDNRRTTTRPEIAGVKDQTYTVYNILGKPTVEIDPLGHKTKTRYNALGKPIEKIYPDGTQEHFSYDCDGSLTSQTDVEGCRVLFTYDPFGRPLTKQFYDPSGLLVEQERFTYTTFNMISHSDTKGITTTYSYDGAGRKVSEKRLDVITHYTYDSMGRVVQERTQSPGLSDRIKRFAYDLLGRIVDEISCDEEGTISNRTRYGYDAAGNKIAITKEIDGHESITLLTYDRLNRLIKTRDPQNRVTHLFYDDNHIDEAGTRVLKKTTVDPKGRQLIEIYDARSRLATTYRLTEFGQLLQREDFVYDACDRRILQKSTLIKGEEHEERLTRWDYDVKGRLIALREAIGTPEERLTQMSYTASGKRQRLIKPDGTTIETRYDAKGRPLIIKSSDGSIDHEYTYGKTETPLRIVDHVQKTLTMRELDREGRIISERLGNGLHIETTYNAYGQMTALTLPDSSEVLYHQEGYHLRAIERRSPRAHYIHTYDRYDQTSHPQQQTLIDGKSQHLQHYDLSGREQWRQTPFTEESYTSIDLADNVLALDLTIGFERLKRSFAYDDLDRLIAEGGDHRASYTYDSHHNRLSKDNTPYLYNALNQLLATGSRATQYDPNGNPISIETPHGLLQLRYDAFNRLIEALTPTSQIDYLYDPLDRLLTKTKTEGGISHTEHILYEGRKDIGTCRGGHLRELRILGLSAAGEIGTAIAIELDGYAYMPLHTINGNLIGLVDPATGDIVGKERYTSFGETLSQEGLTCSWGYQSKRYDSDLNLYFFGFRIYGAQTGRFLTPDPLGFDAIPNLYPFALGNPYLYCDQYGLFAQPMPLSPMAGALLQFSTIRPDAEGYPQCVVKTFETGPNDLQSANYNLGLPEHPSGKVTYTFINGINTTLEGAADHARYISKIVGGYNVHYTYNATHGVKRDMQEAYLGLKGYATEPALRLVELWQERLGELPDDGFIYHICHSQGAIHSYNGLALLPRELSSKIKLLAIAPALSIPKQLVGQVENVASNGFDPVPQIQKYFESRDGFGLTPISYVQKNENAGFNDHGFQSPTFYRNIRTFSWQ